MAALAEKSHARDARRMPRLLMIPVVLAACGGAPTLMGYHRSVLDPLAARELDCDAVEVADATPEGFRYGTDPDARRYLVRGCDQEAAYLCTRPAHTQFSSATPECRRLAREERPNRSRLAPGGVQVGDQRLAD